MILRSIALASTLALAPVAASANWQLDPSHSAVVFEVEHLGYSNVTAVFPEVAADIESFDPENLENASFSVTIDAGSITTFWDARDEHIRGGDFLDVANYPEITFVSGEITRTGDDTAEITGDLTIRDVTQPVTLQAKINKIAPSPMNPDQQVAGFTLTGEIDRTEFGVDAYAPAIGTVLPVTINVELNNEG
ncbi:YceI family protein [Lutibaculum baratangense]|uniref:YceI like family protein n=1 Tax=Lutibaculum baratangense AMV1 TaxID=631454 RepID=V4RPW6_9HYPH|nr:YceI family protein [Lutibaculum baratangense]ESR27319.1 YceI like family protein [Lutibaculum baratangense AMV1]